MNILSRFYLILSTFALILMYLPATAQERDDRAMILNFKGIQYTSKDSLFYTNFRFRMQNRVGFSNVLDQKDNDKIDARIRRLRMRMDGYIYTKRISYSIQLAFTRGDLDWDESGVPNIIRDAVMFYNLSDNFWISFGQNKLPGNRQRVNSSGSLQFSDRSIVNSLYTLDRDFGVTFNLSKKIGNMPINAKAAISTGEGRPVMSTDNGLAYTGRVEILPLGKFKNDGDYSEGDTEREETPKLSIGGGYSYNDRTIRTGGQLGKFVSTPFSMQTAFADAVVKYQGAAYAIEYLNRDTDQPFNQLATDGSVVYANKGWGLNQQASYLINHGYEVAGRYSFVKPHEDLAAVERQTEVLELGVTKYVKSHRLKFQFNTSYTVKDGIYNNSNHKNAWGALFQVELGI